MQSSPDLLDLIDRCRSGDSSAFTPVVQRFQGAGYAVALGMVHDPQDAEDVLQDAFVSAYCRLGQLTDPAAFPGWFCQIVVAHSRDWLRRRGVRQRYADNAAGEAAASPLGTGADAEERLSQRRLWEQVFALREPLRSAALLRYLSGFSLREISAFLQVPLSTVNGRLQQARQHLRRAVTEAKLEDLPMSRIDVSAEVADAVYQIATEPLSETVDVTGIDNIVLFCGANTDVVVEGSDAAELVIEGSSVSMGLSQEEAQQSARATRIRHDRVEDFEASGPHPGEVFSGTNRKADGPEATTAQTTSLWETFCAGKGAGVGIYPADEYRHLAELFYAFPDQLRAALKQSVRISLVQEKAQVLTLPPDAYRPRLQKVFRPNASDPKWLHGPVGYASLTVRVPEGKRLTLMRADSVEVKDVGCSVNLVQCRSSEVNGVAGDVCLTDTPARALTKIKGNLWMRFYSFAGMDWDDEELRARRHRYEDCRVEDVEGEVDIDVGRLQMELARVSGSIRVMNRYGETRFHASEWPAGSRCRLESVCGSVRLFLGEKLVPDLQLTVLTLCGSISYQPYREIDKGEGNSMQLAMFSTVPPLGRTWQEAADADLVVKTESGDVEIERVI